MAEKTLSPSGDSISSGPLTSTPMRPEGASTHSSDLDESYETYRQHGDQEMDPIEAKKVLRKIDLRLVPILVVIYFLQYIDKNGINYASVYGLQKGTNLRGQDYSWLGSIFYFGYLASQFPAGYVIQRLPLGKVIGTTTVIWGMILITTPACTNFAGMATNRFLLGFFEAVVNPGFVLIMSIWYRSSEQPLRLESYYCTNGVATMFGGLIGYAVGHITSGLPRWMYIFLILGSFSIFAGLMALISLPDLPSTAKFLTPHERSIAVARVAANRQGIKNHHFKRYQLVQTLRDPKTWILFIMATGAQVPNSALTSFASLTIKSFGFEVLETQYMQIPGGFVQFTALLTGGFICSRYKNIRFLTMIVANTICILGAGLLVGLPESNKWDRLVALWLCYFQGLGFSMSLTIVSSNIAGYTKKQLTAAILFTGYCVGNIIGPQTFKDSEASGYHSAYIAMLVGYVVKLIAISVLYVYMYLANKKRDREQAVSGDGGEHLQTDQDAKVRREGIEGGMLDMTELDNRAFRYVL